MSDEEIAARLGLAVAEVVEIRCVAELDRVRLEDYLEAETIKERRFRGRS